MTTESYCGHFKLKEKPFSLSADPRYLYMSEQHWEALAHLMYGVEEDWGFVLITGEIGAGKTTLCRLLLGQMPAEVDVAFITNPKVNTRELLTAICGEFGIPLAPGGQSIRELFDLISLHLLEVHARGRKTLLIIDEAQCLSTSVLDLLRLLTNLETEACKLLRIILIGQPELRTKLARPELDQMSQRITARYHLGPLAKKEIAAYLDHRMTIAGATEKHFTDAAAGLLYRMSGGVPRLINVIADRALLGAFMKGEQVVTPTTLRQAGKEVLRDVTFRRKSRRLTTAAWAAAAILLSLSSIALGLFLADHHPHLPFLEKGGTARTAAPATASREPGQTGLAWLPAGLSTAESKSSAYHAVLGQKGISYYASGSASDDSFCSNIEILDLRCLNRKDSGPGLAALPVPAVVTLKAGPDQLVYAAVLSLKEDRAVLRVGEKETEMALTELQRFWSGEYMTLERAIKQPEKTAATKARKKTVHRKGT